MRVITSTIVPIIGLLGLSILTEAMTCDKLFRYHDKNNYGYGFDVACQDITPESQYLFENLTVYKEITVTINNSVLTDVTSHTFKNLDRMRELIINNSSISFDATESIFEDLDLLDNMRIEKSTLTFNDKSFKGLVNLKKIVIIDSNYNFNENNALRNVVKLKSLNIINNKIKSISKFVLCSLAELKELDLSRNLLQDISTASFMCEQGSSSLDLDINNSNQDVSVFEHFINSSNIFSNIEYLNLSFNKISGIGYSFDGLRLLKSLDLQSNVLRRIKNTEFLQMNNLIKINFKNNSIESVEHKVFENKTYLTEINLENNKLQNINFNNLPSIDTIKISHNKLSNISSFGTMGTLRYLDLSYNNLLELKDGAFKNIRNLEYLDLSNNKNIMLHNHSLAELLRLRQLSMGENNIENLPIQLFESLTNLINLDISRNKLVSIDSVFYNQTQLKVLNISYNSLTSLEYNVFEPLKNLRELDIAGNKLKSIQYKPIISNTPSLRIIHVRHNLLSCQLLSKMITFFKENDISFSISEQEGEYEKENIAGIYCNEGNAAAYNSLDNRKTDGGSSPLVTALILLIAVVIVVILSTSLYKAYIYFKRRRYSSDDFELIED